MDEWKPATSEEVQAFVAEHLARCTPKQRDLFAGMLTPPTPIAIDRGGAIETVFVVGRHEDRILWFEDIHDAFEMTTPDVDGGLRPGKFGMFDLSHVLYNLGCNGEETAGPAGAALPCR